MLEYFGEKSQPFGRERRTTDGRRETKDRWNFWSAIVGEKGALLHYQVLSLPSRAKDGFERSIRRKENRTKPLVSPRSRPLSLCPFSSSLSRPKLFSWAVVREAKPKVARVLVSYRDRGSIYTIPVFLPYLRTHRHLSLSLSLSLSHLRAFGCLRVRD